MKYLKSFVVFVYLFVYLLYSPVAQGQRTALDNPLTFSLLRFVKDTIMNAYGHTSHANSPVHNLAQQREQIQKRISKNVPFPCNTTNGRSKTVPTSVHKLRPGDIDIIGAMGDSITAGQGVIATDFVNFFVENRGPMALGGGMYTWREYLTLPNILKVYNPNLYGYATDDAFSHQPASHFNVGEGLAMSRDMPFMARNLVKRMKSDPRVDIENHWKLISLFIGANDICSDMCYIEPPSRVLENHRRDLIKTFRILRDNLPRTIVVLIPVPTIKKSTLLKGKPMICELVAQFGCSCIVGHRFANQQEKFAKIIKEWQKIDQEVSFYSEFQTEDFSVAVQPFTSTADTPSKPDGNIDLRYFSVDCFHFSQTFHAAVSLAVWKSLFEPVGNKSKGNFKDIELSCPSEKQPYIATPKNS